MTSLEDYVWPAQSFRRLGGTPLHFVASDCKLHHLIPDLLEKYKVYVNKKAEDGMTPLLITLSAGCSLDTLNVLVKAGADMNALDEKDGNIHYHAFEGDCSMDVINRLMKFNWEMLFANSDVEKVSLSDDKHIPLKKAIEKRRFLDLIPVLLKLWPIDYLYFGHSTLLYLALDNACTLEDLDGLLRVGADVTQRRSGGNSLSSALEGSCPPSVISRLLELSPVLVRENPKVATPMEIALYNKCPLEIFKPLVNAGAELHETALHYASKSGCCSEIIEEIIKMDPNSIRCLDHWGCIPLHHAKEAHVISTLLRAGSNINSINQYGNVPLRHIFGLDGITLTAVKTFLEFQGPISAQRDAEDENGNTYWHSAVRANAEIVRFFLKAGFDPGRKNNQGDNALLSACKNVCLNQEEKPSVMKELLRGNPGFIEICNNDGDYPFDILREKYSERYAHFENRYIVLYLTPVFESILKWVLLQDCGTVRKYLVKNFTVRNFCERDMRYSFDSDEPVVFLSKFFKRCIWELKLLKSFMVTDKLSLLDLVKNCYISPKFINKFRVEKVYENVLQFDRNLTVYKEEVNEIVRMVKVCSSVYGRLLPFAGCQEGKFLNYASSQQVFDYLTIDDLETLSLSKILN